jgi:serine/threonine protein kinase
VVSRPDDWSRVKDIFARARALPADARDAYMADACRGNDGLQREVESLLAADTRAERFLEAPPRLLDSDATGSLAGQRIGPYHIESRIGAGGMGEVYQGRDTMLGRHVAIKVLLPTVARDAESLTRFRREAQLLASLNHPHIAQIHGFEHAGDVWALVMELVPGPTLAQRIRGRGSVTSAAPTDDDHQSLPLPMAEALGIAAQIAAALEAAHEQGIIHRDLKPANIKVREDGTVKVLDFGLATALDRLTPPDVADRRALSGSADATRTGAIFGTPAYMSPEQARGKTVDRRGDLWAFGCILYEMLTGRRTFDGDSTATVLEAVETTEPEWTSLPAKTPAAIRTLLRRCLEKSRAQRLDSATAARLDIEEALAALSNRLTRLSEQPLDLAAVHSSTTEVARRSTRSLTLVALAGALTSVTLVGVWQLSQRDVPGRSLLAGATVARSTDAAGEETHAAISPDGTSLTSVSRFAIVTPPAQPLNVASNDRDLALSPDGRYLVYRAIGSMTNGSALFLRALDRLEARQISDIDNAYTPFFSPDSRWVAFFERGMLKKVSVTGGPVLTLGPVAGNPLGASWGENNTIVFGTDDPRTGLWRVGADGGDPTVVTRPDASQQESDHGFPSMLPDGRGVLFTITAAQPAKAQVAWIDLEGGQRRTLVGGGYHAEYLDRSAGAGRSGHLIYAAEGALHAVRFDPIRRLVVGESSVVVERVMIKSNGAANYTVARNGTLVYVPEGATAPTPTTTLAWVDRSGREESIEAPPRAYGPPRLAPNGEQIAVSFPDQGDSEIWILDLARSTSRRLTFSPRMDGLPMWSPDGRRIVFMSARSGALNWYSVAADGSGAVERVTTSPTHEWPASISPGGDRVFGFDIAPTSTRRVITATLTGPADSGFSAAPQRVQGLFRGVFPEISPNGRYLAYQSEESGQDEIYVRPFPQVDHGRWQISTGGGTRAAWSRNGRELFYLDATNTLHAVPADTTARTFVVGKPMKVFEAKYVEPNPSRHYDVSPDGRRFLVLKPRGADPNATPATMVVIERWSDELRARVP